MLKKLLILSTLIPTFFFAQSIKFDLGRNIATNEAIVCSFKSFYHPEPIQYKDINGDGKLDAFVSGNSIDLFNRNSFLYIQDSVGHYSNIYTSFKYSNVNSEFGDIDGDNDLDLIISGTNENGTYTTKLFLNDGIGNYNSTLPIPVSSTFWGKFKFADVDNDNDLDFFYVGFDAGNNAQTKLCINDGNGNFTTSSFVTFQKVHSGNISFADVDGDNDLDLFYTGKLYSNSYAYLYTNDGNGNFTQSTSSTFTGVTKPTITFEDLDGDSDLDLLYTGLPDGSAPSFITKLYDNDGSGIYTDNTSAPFFSNEHTSFNIEDLNGDNSKEIIFINNRQEDGVNNEIYENNGSGVFTQNTTFYLNSNLHTISFCDLDNDNDLDITEARTATFYINDGAGNFSESKNLSNGTTALGDVDGDNDLDLLVTGLNTSYIYSGLTPSLSEDTIVTKLYLNDGNGFFNETPGNGFEPVTQSKAKFFDVDNDNDLDLFLIGLNANNIKIANLYLNNGSGSFSLSSSNFDGVTGDFDFGDYDGDNDLDILIIGSNTINNLSVTMYANDGLGNFSSVGDLNLLQTYDGAVEFADIDNDNDLDVYIGGYVTLGVFPGKIFINDGNGTFTPSTNSSLKGAFKGDAVFGDVDGDNDLDLLTSNRYDGSTLYKNDGLGNFTIYNDSTLNSAQNGEIAFSDMDKDGDLDLFITGEELSPSVYNTSYYSNDGNGNYTLSLDSVFTNIAYSSISVGNLDADSLNEVVYLGKNESDYSTKSVLKVHNVIGLANTGSDSVFACNEYTWNNGIEYDSSGSYTHTFTNEQGCDSITTLNLTIGTLEAVITFVNDTITPSFTGDSYQWIDCDNNTILTGETDSFYIPSSNGSYALIMNQSSCTDTSNCIAITHLSIEQDILDLNAFIYPNPSTETITLQTNSTEPYSIKIVDLNGKEIMSKNTIYSKDKINIAPIAKGIYILTLQSTKKSATIQLIKQ